MYGYLSNLIIIWTLVLIAVTAILIRADRLEKEERQRQAKREAQRRHEMKVIGARMRRQLTVERFEGIKAKKKPIRKFCGVLATMDNQSIVR